MTVVYCRSCDTPQPRRVELLRICPACDAAARWTTERPVPPPDLTYGDRCLMNTHTMTLRECLGEPVWWLRP